jgi:hypothetical protein
MPLTINQKARVYRLNRKKNEFNDDLRFIDINNILVLSYEEIDSLIKSIKQVKLLKRTYEKLVFEKLIEPIIIEDIVIQPESTIIKNKYKQSKKDLNKNNIDVKNTSFDILNQSTSELKLVEKKNTVNSTYTFLMIL